jgi:hypothetical protein
MMLSVPRITRPLPWFALGCSGDEGGPMKLWQIGLICAMVFSAAAIESTSDKLTLMVLWIAFMLACFMLDR